MQKAHSLHAEYQLTSTPFISNACKSFRTGFMSIQFMTGCLCCQVCLCCPLVQDIKQKQTWVANAFIIETFLRTDHSDTNTSLQCGDAGTLMHWAQELLCTNFFPKLAPLFPLKCSSVFTVCSIPINTLLVFPSIINKCVLQRAYSSIFSLECCRHQSFRDIVWSPILFF